MASILTNASGLSALQNLATTQKALATTQNQISTGLKVSSASDNASYWSIASTMKSDNNVLDAVKTSLAQGTSMIDVATAAINSAIDVMNQIKKNLVIAKQPGADLAKINTDLAQAASQLKSTVDSAAYNGQNWTQGAGTSGTAGLVIGYNRNSAGATGVATMSLTTTNLIDTGGTTGVLQSTQGSTLIAGVVAATAGVTDFTKIGNGVGGTAITAGSIDDALANADATIAKLQDYSSNLGATKTRLATQTTFINNLSDGLTKGVSSMVDADMNEASTKLQALQTQQQLGVQSLSIANQNSQIILKLFGG